MITCRLSFEAKEKNIASQNNFHFDGVAVSQSKFFSQILRRDYFQDILRVFRDLRYDHSNYSVASMTGFKKFSATEAGSGQYFQRGFSQNCFFVFDAVLSQSDVQSSNIGVEAEFLSELLFDPWQTDVFRTFACS